MAAIFRYEYILAARPSWPGQETHDTHCVDIYVHAVTEVYEGGQTHQELEDEPILTGYVDWQDGVTLFQVEHIDPSEFVAIMATVHAAIWEARTLIGSRWTHGESGADYDPADAPTS